MTLSLLILVALGGAGLLAGFVDAIAGGGGLIALPALLAAGFPPLAALGTNKVQSVIGTGTAALTYWRGGYMTLRPLMVPLVATYVAAFCGAWAVKQLDVSLLENLVPVALILVALYFILMPKLSDEDRHSRLSWVPFVALMGLAVGFYDGILGPGTGSFLTAGYVALFGLGVTRAAGHTKMLNLASNLGALTLFIPSGDVVWPAAAAMAIGQVIGGYLGARSGIRFGAKLIRPLVALVSLALAARALLLR
jgi:uncharacterized membrane protein YfcA